MRTVKITTPKANYTLAMEDRLTRVFVGQTLYGAWKCDPTGPYVYASTELAEALLDGGPTEINESDARFDRFLMLMSGAFETDGTCDPYLRETV